MPPSRLRAVLRFKEGIMRVVFSLFSVFLVGLFVAGFIACGGGGSCLEGTWYGPGDDNPDDPNVVEVTFDADGNITRIAVDDVDSGLQGTTSEVGPDFFNVALDNADTGGIMVDSSRRHMVYFDDGGLFAVLQKGATALPTYAGGDVIGTWSAFAFRYSSDPGTYEKEPYNSLMASASASSAYNYILYGGPIDRNGVFETFDPAFGLYRGAMKGSPLVVGVTSYMTPDGQCMGLYSGYREGHSWPEDFTYFLLEK